MKNSTPARTLTLDEWLAKEVARGCDPNAMINAMMDAGYAAEDAVSYVTKAFASAKAPIANIATEHAIKIPDDSKAVYQRIQRYGSMMEFKPIVQLESPRMMIFDNFISDEECDALVGLSKSKLTNSNVIDQKSGEFVPHPERTSRGTYFEHQSHPVVIAIESRVTELFGFPLKHQEAIQILNYPIGAEYKPHFDYFAPEIKGNQAILAEAGQRLATLIMYLNTPEEGGHTVLPTLGLSITAKKGSALYFENVDVYGHVDPKTLHGGAPVIAGEKWIATKWLREKPLF